MDRLNQFCGGLINTVINKTKPEGYERLEPTYSLLVKNRIEESMENIKNNYVLLKADFQNNFDKIELCALKELKDRCDKFVIELSGCLEDFLRYDDKRFFNEAEHISNILETSDSYLELIKEIRAYVKNHIPMIEKRKIETCEEKVKTVKMLRKDINVNSSDESVDYISFDF